MIISLLYSVCAAIIRYYILDCLEIIILSEYEAEVKYVNMPFFM